MTLAALPTGPEPEARIDHLPPDESRGTAAMELTILTEALLFATLFFSYFYLGHRHPVWPPHPPKILLALVLLAILAASSGVIWLAERNLQRGRPTVSRLLTILTLLLGLAFVAVQALEYRNHLRELRPSDGAYGSLFYVITSFHGLHVVVGLLMLTFVACLPSLPPARSPHRPLHNAALYWHFVDAVWICVVFLLYLLPRWVR